MAPSLTTFRLILECVRDVFLPRRTLTQRKGLVLGRMSEKPGCGVSLGIVRITDLDFAHDAEGENRSSIGSNSVAKQGSKAARIAIVDQEYGDMLDATIESIPVSGEDVEVTRTFTYISSAIHSSTSCELKVNL